MKVIPLTMARRTNKVAKPHIFFQWAEESGIRPRFVT